MLVSAVWRSRSAYYIEKGIILSCSIGDVVVLLTTCFFVARILGASLDVGRVLTSAVWFLSADFHLLLSLNG